MRTVITLALLTALGAPAYAGDDVGVIVTGEGSMQPQLRAQIEGWLSQHGHLLVPTPLPSEAIPLLADCIAMDDKTCVRNIVDQRATSATLVYAHLDAKNANNGTRDVTLTAYWLNKGHDAIGERKTCEHCTDQSLRTTADEVMKKLLGVGDVGHVKLKSTPPGAKITIDGTPIGVTPLDWDLPPGKHTIQMDKAGLQPQSRDLVVASNKTELFAMKLTSSGGDEEGGSGSRLIPIGLIAAGGAALATGIVMIAIDQDPSPTLGPTIRNTGPTGVGLAIGGAVVAGAGACWLLLRSPKTASTPVAAVTSDSAYIGWLGRF